MLKSMPLIIGDSSVRKNLDRFNSREKALRKLLLFWNDNKRGKKLNGSLADFYSIRYPMQNDEGRLVIHPFWQENIAYVGEADSRNKVYKKAKRKIKTMEEIIRVIEKANLTSLI